MPQTKKEKADAKRALVKRLAQALYELRQSRATDPEGYFDNAKRWYPSGREDCGGSGSRVRSPTRSWPYSYLMRCRRRVHCANLIRAALLGYDVPPDVRKLVSKAGPDPWED